MCVIINTSTIENISIDTYGYTFTITNHLKETFFFFFGTSCEILNFWILVSSKKILHYIWLRIYYCYSLRIISIYIFGSSGIIKILTWMID